jgi:small subunit ribosomal protein S13
LHRKGFGSTKIKKINTLLGLPYCTILKRDLINDIFKQEERLSQKDLRKLNIGVYINNGCRRGIKHFKNLPVSGQRNRTNAKTRKKFSIY